MLESKSLFGDYCEMTYICLGKDISNCPGFQDSYCLKPEASTIQKINLVGCLIFVTEDKLLL